jgi:hypothetical protein
VGEGVPIRWPPPESHGYDRPSGGPSPGHRTSPPGVSLPSRVLAEPGSGSSVSRSPPALGAFAPGSGVFPGPASRGSEEHRGPLLGLAPLQGFQPTAPAGPKTGSSRGVLRPDDDRTSAGPAHPGLPHPAPSGLRVSTLPPACSLRTLPIRGSAPSLGFTLQGLAPSGRPRPFPDPCPPAVSRLSLPSPLRTRRSGGPPRLQGFAPTGEPRPSGSSWLPSGPLPSWVAVPSEALVPPRWSRLPGSSPPALSRPESRRHSGHRRSRVSLAARSGGLSRVHRLPWGLPPRPALGSPPKGLAVEQR